MRKANGQFRSRRPTDEEAKAILVLVKAGYLKLVVAPPELPQGLGK